MKELFLKQLQSIVPNLTTARFLLAVSGGVDSSVMTQLFYIHKLHFDIAHCNFHLRGEDSNLDMDFVQHDLLKSFEKKGLRTPTVLVKEFDTFSIQQNSGSSIEMVARDLRYDWFRELSPNYDYICTAHHANDNLETIILNLVRGTGYKGLNGIPEQNLPFIRPLLHFSSDAIKQYAADNNIPFRVDLSNHSDQYQRNKIRNHVIPVLEQINPNVVHTVSRNIQLFNKQYAFYKNQIEEVKKRLLFPYENGFKLNINQLLEFQNAEMILFETLSDFQFNYSTVESIYNQLSGESGKQFFSEKYKLIKDRTELFIYPLDSNKEIHTNIIHSITEFYKYEIIPYLDNFYIGDTFISNPNVAYFDWDKIPFPLMIRTWEEGDWFHPFGMKGKKKLSDYFIDLKLNLNQKQQVHILCEANNPQNIVWIIGFRTDNRYKVTPNTQKMLRLSLNQD
ncbi:MAG: tRNA(Ile)-lysidine synthetase [Bacteroidetes bacterium]|nr:tRNA(Ile)-lysidine synthetase [Bacteroidota bacterium]